MLDMHNGCELGCVTCVMDVAKQMDSWRVQEFIGIPTGARYFMENAIAILCAAPRVPGCSVPKSYYAQVLQIKVFGVKGIPSACREIRIYDVLLKVFVANFSSQMRTFQNKSFIITLTCTTLITILPYKTGE